MPAGATATAPTGATAAGATAAATGSPVDGQASVAARADTVASAAGNGSADGGGGSETVASNATGADDRSGHGRGPPRVQNETTRLVRSWQATPSGAPLNTADGLAAKDNGGYVFAGTAGFTSRTDLSTGNARIGVVGPEGDLTGSDVFGTEAIGRDVARISDGSFVAVGADDVTQQVGPLTPTERGLVVASYGPDGTQQWRTSPHYDFQEGEFEANIAASEGYGVTETPDGGAMVTGRIVKVREENNRDPKRSAGSVMLTKIDGNGEEVYNRSLRSEQDALWVGQDVVPTLNGYLVVGERVKGAKAGDSERSGLVVASDGRKLTSWSAPGGGSGLDSLGSVVRTDNDEYFAVGTTSSGGDQDAWVLKLSPDGTVQWERTLGGPGDQVFNGIVETETGNLTMAGSYAASSGVGSRIVRDDVLLSQITPEGEFVWNATLERDGAATAGDIVLQGDYYGIAGEAGTNGGDTFVAQVIRCRDTTGDVSVDADDDGLCDNWEANGFDVDGDGTPEFDLPAKGADPEHKDIFVEVDYMDCGESGSDSCGEYGTHDHEPMPKAFDRVEKAFADAPVDNPDGEQGVDVTFQVDSAVPERQNVTFDDVHDLKYGTDECGTGSEDAHLGTDAERSSQYCERILNARELTFHYLLSGHSFAKGDGTLGAAPTPGNDVSIYAAGPQVDDTVRERARFNQKHDLVPDRTVAEERLWLESVTIMHELGHNLNLSHGGRDDVNNKPNYLSIMNYQYAHDEAGKAVSILGVDRFEKVRIGAELDYSTQNLSTIDESALDETVGLGGPVGEISAFLVNQTGDDSPERYVIPAEGDVDWNLDGNSSGTVSRDVNDDGEISTLRSYEDWPYLEYNFRDSKWYTNNVGQLADIGQSFTIEAHLNAGLGGPDADDDGVENVDDNCPLAANADQADGNDDGQGDACTRDTEPPVAGFDYDVGANGTVSFSTAAADPEHRGVVSYTWEFGDGASASGANLTHVFEENGNYDVTLTVEDYDGDAATVEETITVEAGEGGSVGETDPKSVTGTPTPTETESTATPDAGTTATPDGGTGATATPTGETPGGTATATDSSAPGGETTTASTGMDGSGTGDATPTDSTGLFGDDDTDGDDDEGSGGSGPGFGAPVAVAALLALLALSRLRTRHR